MYLVLADCYFSGDQGRVFHVALGVDVDTSNKREAAVRTSRFLRDTFTDNVLFRIKIVKVLLRDD